MRYIYILAIICCSIIFLSNQNIQNQHKEFDGFAFSSGGFDVLLDLPEIPYDYKGIEVPSHYFFLQESDEWSYIFGDYELFNTMSEVEIENNATTLGRVIFYDQNMSFNRTVSCASCHQQTKGFADDKAFSEGFDGVLTHRNTLNITDFKSTFYPNLFWDDSSTDIREASILPFLNSDEMGMTMREIIDRMEATDYYPDLFNKAYGSEKVTEHKIADALSQFMISISSYETKYDKGFENEFADFTESELNGMTIFKTHCDNCHLDIVPKIDEDINDNTDGIFEFFLFLLDFNGPHNTGLDLNLEDLGVANTTGIKGDEGKFKTPRLKNVELTGPYMHDGRFETLREVIDFYSEDLLPHPNRL